MKRRRKTILPPASQTPFADLMLHPEKLETVLKATTKKKKKATSTPPRASSRRKSNRAK